MSTGQRPAAPGGDRKANAAARQQRSDEAKPLRRELTSIDHRLGVMTGDRDKVEAALASPGISPADRAEHGKRLKQIETEVATLEARWLELSTRIDAMSTEVG